MEAFFRKLAQVTSETLGSSKAFFFALLLVLIWLVTGPMFDYSDTWQLFINTTTTVITFLVVILIQHTQNHDAKALHLKLDELIRALKSARTRLVNLEQMSDEELSNLQDEFQTLRDEAIKHDKDGTREAKP